MRHKNAAIFSVLMLGFTAMLSQIVVIRELLVVFSGNELSVGIMFAGWLAWGALGSFFSASLRRPVRSARSYAVYQAALAFSLPLAVILIRVSRGMAGMSTGEIIGFLPMILIVLGVLSIPCFLMGAMFSLGCRLYREAGQDASESITHVYVLEAAGALFGGIAGTGLIALSIPPLYVILGLAIINFFSSFVIFLSSRRENRNGPFLGIFLLAGFLCAVFILSGGGKALNGFSEKILWKGFDVAVSRDSVYGNLVITKEKDQISLYENGLHVCTVPDALSAENAVHFAMLGTERPERVLLIGGGAGGALEEILKYQVKHIDYLELDPALLPLLRGYIGHTPAWEDRRVSVINTDGRAFVKRTDEKYDCVIVNLGDPYTAQINRFYTADFFE
ncbi:MAG: hypothetical protein KKG84_05810, partial [Candidatus Omnitrophica bacterium]|nr:hypothetical protein [Candidatus Omnitrophota bacterium]